MSRITPEDAEQYVARWTAVNALEIEELRRTPMETKLRQLASLMASRDLFATDPGRENDAEEVRQRWARLRQVLGG
jgi:hypothetical protein